MTSATDANGLVARLEREGLSATSWGNSPGDKYAEHRHDYDKVLVGVAGSITFHLREQGLEVELLPGHRLDLPAGTAHAATVGSDGVSCLEAHLPPGALPRLARRSVEEW